MPKTVAELEAQCRAAEVHMVILTEDERAAMLVALKDAQQRSFTPHSIRTLGYAITKLTLDYAPATVHQFPTAGLSRR
jgi:hypothetical protein